MIERKGLFAEDMLARTRGCYRDLRLQCGRNGDRDRGDLGRGYDRAPVTERFRNAEPVSDRSRAIVRARADRDDLTARIALERRRVYRLTESDPDDADAESRRTYDARRAPLVRTTRSGAISTGRGSGMMLPPYSPQRSTTGLFRRSRVR